MAIDRNIIEWSNEDKAFKAKSYVEIFNMLLENYRAIYGQDIDLNVQTAFGEELRMEAEQLYDFAKLAEDVYYSLDVNNAKGAILDNLVAFTSNLIRKENVQSILTANLKIVGNSNISLDSANLVYVQDEYNILWKVESNDESTELEVGATLATAPNNNVKLICSSFGENQMTPNVTQLLVNRSFYSNEIELDTIIYEQIGSIEETDEQLRQRKNNTLSYNSKALLDSIRDKVLKNIYSVKDIVIYNANGRKTGEANVDADNNTLIPLLLNDETTVETITIPRHDLLVLIQPQTGLAEQANPLLSFIQGTEPTSLSNAIGNVLKDKITPGISTTFKLLKRDLTPGSPTENQLIDVNNDTGYIDVILPITVGNQTYTERYSFYVVNKYSPQISLIISRKNNYDSVTSQARIREAIYNLSTTYIINEDLDIGEILTTAMNANLDPSNPTFMPIGITIGNGNTSELKVNNGYWLVDKTAESGSGLADWNIIITEM